MSAKQAYRKKICGMQQEIVMTDEAVSVELSTPSNIVIYSLKIVYKLTAVVKASRTKRHKVL